MLKKVKSCTLFMPGELTMKISEKDGEAVISKTVVKKNFYANNTEKKRVDINVLRSLDIFFNSLELKRADDETDDYTRENEVIIRFAQEGLCFFTRDSETVKQINDYLNAYFDGTAQPFTLSFHSFDGGGPEYSFENEKTGVFTWFSERVYNNPNHEQLCGSGFDVRYSIYPLRAGEATAVIKGSSPICREPDRRLFVSVGEDLSTEYHVEEINDNGDGF